MIGGGILFALASVGYACLLLFLQHSAKTPSFLPIFQIILDIQGLDLYLLVALYLAMSLFFLVPSPRKHPRTVELRKYGILRGPSAIRFIPWSKVTECHWISPKTLFGVSLCWRIPKFFKRGRLTINENKIAPGQKEAVTAVLGRFAPVYDRDGTLLAKPEETTAAATSVSRQSRFRFQFDLQTLLLFFVFASCVASLYGIQYRREQPQRDAMARLANLLPLSPTVFAAFPGTWISPRAPKADRRRFGRRGAIEPTVHVGPYGRSDYRRRAKHLEGLTRLFSITLIDTAVTEDGAKRLHEALPNAGIFYGPAAAKKFIKPDNEP